MTEDEYADLEWDLEHEGRDEAEPPYPDGRPDAECEGCGLPIFYDEDGDLIAAEWRPAGGAPEDGKMLICDNCLEEARKEQHGV